MSAAFAEPLRDAFIAGCTCHCGGDEFSRPGIGFPGEVHVAVCAADSKTTAVIKINYGDAGGFDFGPYDAYVRRQIKETLDRNAYGNRAAAENAIWGHKIRCSR